MENEEKTTADCGQCDTRTTTNEPPAQPEGSGLMPTPRELTFGEKAVGLTFNPGGDEKVTKVKKLFAEAIDIVVGLEGESDFRTILQNSAIDQAIIAQMCAVKAITWRD